MKADLDVKAGLSSQLGEVLAELAAGEIPAEAVEAAKSKLLHALGVSIASSALPAAESAWTAVERSGGDCLALGRRASLSDAAAAFYNGVAGHSSLQEDAGPGGLRDGSHPGVYVVPAALAAAESVQATGAQLIRGLVAGYEAVSRLGEAAPPEILGRGFRPIVILGPFGAAAAAAAIYGLPSDRVATALALAANTTGGVSQGTFDGTMEMYFHAGFAARNGLFAAQLAAAGAVASASSLEGRFGFFATFGGAEANVGELTRERDELAICRVGVKRFPSCLQNQETMALILGALPQGVALEDVERVTLRRPARGTNGLNSPGVDREPPFENMLQTQMSARFTAAAALLGRPVESVAYFREGYRDADAVALAERIDLVPSDGGSPTLEVVFRAAAPLVLDGDASQVLFPPPATIRSRFVARAEPLLGVAAEEAAALVDRLESLDDARALTSKLRPPQTGTPRT